MRQFREASPAPQRRAALVRNTRAFDDAKIPLSAVAERPMTSKEWAEKLGMGPGTFFHVRARLVQMELISRDGEGRGARWALSEDGWATAGALGAAAPQRTLAA